LGRSDLERERRPATILPRKSPWGSAKMLPGVEGTKQCMGEVIRSERLHGSGEESPGGKSGDQDSGVDRGGNRGGAKFLPKLRGKVAR